MLTIETRKSLVRGNNWNKAGIDNGLKTSKEVYDDIKTKYGNHYSRYNIISGI